MVLCNLVGGEDSFWPQVWTSVSAATITGNDIHADKTFISGRGITGAYLWTENTVSVSPVLLVTRCYWQRGRSWLIQESEEQDLAPQQQLRCLQRESTGRRNLDWTDIGWVCRGKGRLQCSTTHIWHTHSIFNFDIQMISKGCSATSLSNIQAVAFLQPQNSSLLKLWLSWDIQLHKPWQKQTGRIPRIMMSTKVLIRVVVKNEQDSSLSELPFWIV